MMKAVACWIPVRLTRGLHASRNHLSGNVLIVRPFFFFLFTIHANRLMVVNRQKPLIPIAHRIAASLANLGTGKLLLPIVFHVYPSPWFFIRLISKLQTPQEYKRT